MDRTLTQLRRVFSRLNLICAIIGASLLFMIAATICFEVTMRALGGASRLWVIEVSEYALLFITFLGAPYLLEKNQHVVMDLVFASLSGRPRMALQIVNASIGLALCAVLTVVGISVVLEQFELGVRQVTVLRPQSWWITAALPIGMGLMAVQFLDQIIRSFRGEVI
ncbi:TRAP transporter small permease [Roseicyclus sp.]|uniref:TRAP transporter small permease n=1 Tax=Roseicyclus sp. TaxID=1914329 RepID=UPI003F9EE3DB